MKAAGHPRGLGAAQRMLVVDPRHAAVLDAKIGELPLTLEHGDVVVINDAATVPASLRATTADGTAHELRLTGPPQGGSWPAIVLGAGDWRTDTDRRPPPARLRAGDELDLGTGTARVCEVKHPRLVQLGFPGTLAQQWHRIFRDGRPIQYAYASEPLALADVQTAFASRPWAVEMPSAARPLRVATVLELRRRGVEILPLTHAAGLSATGDPELDRALPWRERFHIPAATAAAVNVAREDGRTVLAIGTSVVRALEGSAAGGRRVKAGEDETELVVDADYEPTIVTGVLSGVHEPETSHAFLLDAFGPASLWQRARSHAQRHRYLIHEFGDATLVLPGAAAALSAHLTDAAHGSSAPLLHTQAVA